MNEEIRKDIVNVFERKLEQFKSRQMSEDEEWDFFRFFLREKYKESEKDIDIKYFSLGWYIYNYILPKETSTCKP